MKNILAYLIICTITTVSGGTVKEPTVLHDTGSADHNTVTHLLQLVTQCVDDENSTYGVLYPSVLYLCLETMSCIGSCGNSLSMGRDDPVKVCSCDFLCKLYGDCCDDFDHMCPSEALKLNHRLEQLIFANKTFECVNGVQMVTQCAAGQSPSTHDRSNITDYLTRSLTVTHVGSGITYFNQSIYECNLDPEIHLQPESNTGGGQNDDQCVGCILQPDGPRLQPDGSRLQPDGSKLQPDGSIPQPDGSRPQPDGSRLKIRHDELLDGRTALRWRRKYTSKQMFDVSHLAMYLETGQAPPEFKEKLADVPPEEVLLRRCVVSSMVTCGKCAQDVKTHNFEQQCTDLAHDNGSNASTENAFGTLDYTVNLKTDLCNVYHNQDLKGSWYHDFDFQAVLDLNSQASFVVGGSLRSSSGWSRYQCYPSELTQDCEIEGTCLSYELYSTDRNKCEGVEYILISVEYGLSLPLEHSNIAQSKANIKSMLREQPFLTFQDIEGFGHNDGLMIIIEKPRLNFNSFLWTQNNPRNGFAFAIDRSLTEFGEWGNVVRLNATFEVCSWLDKLHIDPLKMMCDILHPPKSSSPTITSPPSDFGTLTICVIILITCFRNN